MRDEIIQKITEAKAVLNATKKTYYSQHFYEFNRDILGWPDMYEPLHRQVCDFVQDNWQKKKLLILLPRGTFKSSIITVGFSLWRIGIDPDVRINISNAVYPLAVSFLSQIKKHIQSNQKFKDVFGELYVPTEQWREDRISVSKDKLINKEPTVWAFGSGASSTGSHFNVAILDDLVARENIGTKDQLMKPKNYYRDVLDLIDPMPGGHRPVIIVGTTWHWDDLYAWIMDRESGLLDDFAVLRLPAYEGEWGEGKLLFPTRLDWKALKKQKEQQGNAHFSAQYMLDPIAEEDQIFRAPFRKYEETDIRGHTLRTFFAVDPALSEEKYADYSAMVCIGVDKDNVWYILDVWRDRVQPNALIDQMFWWYEKWKPVSIGLETTAYQRMLTYTINDEMRKRGIFLPIKELKHAGQDQSKSDRIKSLQPRYERGTVFHPQKTSVPVIEYLEDELLRFPKGAHDDLCLIAGTKILTNKGQVNIENIKVGDCVMTRNGYRKVLESGMTGKKKVITSLGLTGTPNHPVITKQGIKQLQDVKVSDKLHVWNEKQFCIEEKSIIDIQTQKGDSLESIFGDMINGNILQLRFIAKYGLITLEKYLKDAWYTTKMVILSTMKFPTLSYLPSLNMQSCILMNFPEKKSEGGILRLQESTQINGMDQKKGENGILSMEKKRGDIESFLQRFVDFVNKTLRHLFLIEQFTAQTAVDSDTEVYNLKVEDASEYFANNILVHNCDAMASLNELAFAPRAREQRSTHHVSHYPA